MFFGFGRILYVCLLLVNALTVLSEDRFLGRVNLTPGTYNGPPNTVTARGITLAHSVRTLAKIPLLAINVLIVVYNLVV